MGKKQHQQDKLYLTNKEKLLYGGKSSTADLQKDLLDRYKRLPFGHCCLSLQPYSNPVCNLNGYIFDLENIVKFVTKYKKDPISGEASTIKQYFKLNMSKTKEGNYQCPIIFKEFNEHSHIVAIKTTGNVFSYEAVDELNFKAKNYKDLITDEPFVRKDVIVLQEPSNIDRQNLSKYYYLINNLKWDDLGEGSEDSKDGKANLKSMNHTLAATLEEMSKKDDKSTTINKDHYKSVLADEFKTKEAATDKFNRAIYSTGQVGASFTSTAMTPILSVVAANIGDDEYRYSQINKKGYVQLKTNFGALNFELYCKQCPRACENFIRLCATNYYDNTKFHRLIKYFIIQGGDPTATGKGGQSIWGEPFKDEFDNNFSHDSRGVLSMANSGRNTNKSQFFITFKSCKNLDKKHTIFGRLVGGFETLDALENVPTSDKNDRPLKDILIENTTVFVNPFEEVDKKLEDERRMEEEANSTKVKQVEKINGLTKGELEQCKRKVGALISESYIKKLTSKLKPVDEETNPKKKKKIESSGFSNFSSW